ncbi:MULTISPECIES: cytochrome d ubiquinol oxidase subunit II [Vibrio]|uniref:Cytochrome d ubiquinol oxidase subunit II n=2 Tax=Vibrio TaxID=662 RepID=A0A7X4RU64_9VIBR|nr:MULTISPECIES: cytochrome d ubiquinol oxidase subunit II [Vibrio]MBF9000017.1 cytochrome d ubiquinol oxidase subunit II [Vibrio nitrifigilis]MZI92769.1 cytochrome d ubiquinol oxidase subunit II [Vibrio eleionomae]
MFDYEVLRFIWWVLIGVLFVGYAVAEGFDMGVGALVPFIGKTNTERRMMINTIAPHWDGNQVWLITAGGALFAAWPMVYASSFSGFYIGMILVLASLWLRPLCLEYRIKIDDPRWRNAMDIGLAINGIVIPLIIGVAFGNLLQGVPLSVNEFLQVRYEGGFFGLLNPFGIVSGLVCVIMVQMQGSAWLQMKASEEVYDRARSVTQITGVIVAVLMVIAGIWVQNIDGFVVKSVIDGHASSNPLNKEVVRETGAWMYNFGKYPAMWIAPVLAVVMPLLAALFSRAKKGGFAFVSSSLGLAGIVLTAGFAMFPFIMPSSVNPNVSLTMWDATSSQLTLTVMTCVAAVFVPIILCYTAFCYYKMYGRLTKEHVENPNNAGY